MVQNKQPTNTMPPPIGQLVGCCSLAGGRGGQNKLDSLFEMYALLRLLILNNIRHRNMNHRNIFQGPLNPPPLDI